MIATASLQIQMLPVLISQLVSLIGCVSFRLVVAKLKKVKNAGHVTCWDRGRPARNEREARK
jgi:hypothetical protein